jgi:cbb3-type cytochrome oxidase subunit 3
MLDAPSARDCPRPRSRRSVIVGDPMNTFVAWLIQYWFYVGAVLTFVAIIAWVYRPSAKGRYKVDRSIPFEPKGEDKKDRVAP